MGDIVGSDGSYVRIPRGAPGRAIPAIPAITARNRRRARRVQRDAVRDAHAAITKRTLDLYGNDRLDRTRAARSARRVNDTSKRITPADLWALPRVGAPVPAPDGAFVVVGAII